MNIYSIFYFVIIFYECDLILLILNCLLLLLCLYNKHEIKEEAVAQNYAYYHPETGLFTWKESK
jgi:hypothetical protein